jgi:hypothetical protein
LKGEYASSGHGLKYGYDEIIMETCGVYATGGETSGVSGIGGVGMACGCLGGSPGIISGATGSVMPGDFLLLI